MSWSKVVRVNRISANCTLILFLLKKIPTQNLTFLYLRNQTRLPNSHRTLYRHGVALNLNRLQALPFPFHNYKKAPKAPNFLLQAHTSSSNQRHLLLFSPIEHRIRIRVRVVAVPVGDSGAGDGDERLGGWRDGAAAEGEDHLLREPDRWLCCRRHYKPAAASRCAGSHEGYQALHQFAWRFS